MLKNLNYRRKIGIDINEEAIKMAKSNGIDAVNDISSIADGWADKIISNHALEHLQFPSIVLKQLHMKIRIGGKFNCVVPHECNNQEYKPNDPNMHLY